MEHHPKLLMLFNQDLHPTTIKSYKAKWASFCCFAAKAGLSPSSASLPTILTYLLHLSQWGPSLSSLKVYLAYVVAHQPPNFEAVGVFRYLTVKAFFKGLLNSRSCTCMIPPQWSLHLILDHQMCWHFEPMAMALEHLLILETIILVVITLAHRENELVAMRADPPYPQFHPHKVILYPNKSFFPKVASDFHISQPIILPAFFQAETGLCTPLT
ncbi:hypothetical protein JRQ81_015943 [Phrynocephalus forsythii]|uniref:Uncharacterized protein n=1 Tax=Phrynocephalus forsythii TaxID=171643 RepID=A0A9Q0XVY4_9SAUR|nr:hypothetical protein JRQ81_015943 [Phrynocephalus forsythii]